MPPAAAAVKMRIGRFGSPAARTRERPRARVPPRVHGTRAMRRSGSSSGGEARSLPQLFGRVLDGFDDVHVAGAPAEVARDGLADLALARVRVRLEQRVARSSSSPACSSRTAARASGRSPPGRDRACRPARGPRPSSTSQPSAWTASTVHDLTGSPSSRTVQAPQCEVSQPMWVPVRRRSRAGSGRAAGADSTSASCAAPLTVTLILMLGHRLRPPARSTLCGARARQHARHLLLVLDRAAPVRARRARSPRRAARLGETSSSGCLPGRNSRPPRPP